ncbi:MarR family winged helix-turn-helix transcriptional regulator [Nonomuraea sp. AD125B]|uniref:MarR family winged helix-turn-helix transcriptional regulator n=1 Tax=Nonomuraea sp. AD125B TaxID=3242897 RepID=UPI0035280495
MSPSAPAAPTANGVVEVIPLLHRALDRRIELDFPHPKPPEVQLAALRLVRERDGITVRELAEALLMKTSNASAMITQMTAAGLLRRERDPADRRVLHLHLTDEARRRVEEAHDLFTGSVLRAFGSLGEDDRAAIAAALPALRRLAGLIQKPS